MSPRKKSKPNTTAKDVGSSTRTEAPAAEASAKSLGNPNDSKTLQNTSSNQSDAASATTEEPAPSPANASGQTLQKKASQKWLGRGGSWRSKASATVRTAKDSIGISVSGGAASPLPDAEPQSPKDQSPAKFLTKRKSSKSVAIPASMTKLSVSSDGALDQTEEQKPQEPTPEIDEPPLPPLPPRPRKNETNDPGTWGWKSWWSRPDGYSEAPKAKDADEAERTPLPGATPSEEPNATTKELGTDTPFVAPPQGEDTEIKDAPSPATSEQDAVVIGSDAGKEAPPNAPSNRASWFWSWSSTQNTQPNPPPALTTSDESTQEPEGPTPAQPEAPQDVQPSEQQDPVTEPPSAPAPISDNVTAEDDPKSSGWAFWFKDKPKAAGKGVEETSQKHVGEVAVSDTPSQSHPEPAQFNEQEQSKKDATDEAQPPVVEEPPVKRTFLSLRGRPKARSKNATSVDLSADTPSSSKAATPSKTSPVLSPTFPQTAPAAEPAPKQAPKGKDEPANLILPEFSNTYSMVQQPSFWKQIRQYFLGGEAAMPHLHINPAPPRVRKAVAIGVHGFFPAPIFQKVMGQPKGTSIRFSNAAATAIKDWCEIRGYEPEIEQIALEGEGFIADRVKTLWKLLLNWIDHIKQADFILVACHSQGVPVAIMLVAKLIQFGCVNASRIGICAMAGVNMGPFIEYKTKYFGPTALELFEFSDPKSLVSQMYLAALDEVLRFGVRILYVGSIDDQLVSVESSTFSTLSHPYIYRAVFVDGRIHAPDFLTHLVGFTLKLRNLGLPDHGLIRELSPALAGSLYGGEGHSRVYEDPHVYTLAVQHALETTSLPVSPTQGRPNSAASFAGINIPVPGAKVDMKDVYKLRVKDYSDASVVGVNPFYLPWAMRGLLEEEFVKKALGDEVEELLGMFEEWRPVGKQLKDVRFRLEAVRSKL